MDFENSTTYILTQLAVAYRNSLERVLGEIGLHSGQIFVLIALWKSDGQSQINLVKNLNLSAPTINKMVKSLIANGYVRSEKCATDKRLMRIFLTEKGVDCQNSVAEQWNKVETQAYASLTDTEKLVITQLFTKLKENLGRNIFSI